MVKVTIDRELAYELVDSKVDQLNKKITIILENWDYDDVGKFLSDIQYNEIENAEKAGKEIRNSLDKISFLVSLKSYWEDLDEDNFTPDFEYEELGEDDEIDLVFQDPILEDELADAIDNDYSGDYIEIDEYDEDNLILNIDDDEE